MPGAHPLLKAWEALFVALSEAGADAAGALNDADAADAVWRAVEAQARAWAALARRLGGTAETAQGAEALARFLDPAQWLFGGDAAPPEALRRLIEGPAAGPFAATAADQAMRRALARHRTLVARAYLDAAREAARRAAADPPLTLGAGQTIWLEALAVLDRLHADPDFLRSQAAVVDAAVAARAAQERALAAFCRDQGLPTRADFIAMADAIADLRRELRALKRDLGQP